MKIRWIKILNYRQFAEKDGAKLVFDPNLTVIAGANNSGKTSVMELIFNILGNNKIIYNVEDIPVKNIERWLAQVQPIFETKLDEKTINKTNFSNRIEQDITEVTNDGNRKIKKECCLSALEVKICVTYDPVQDDIQKYAEYLMDFDSKAHEFYFWYLMELDYKSFLINLEEDFLKIKRRYDSLCVKKEESEKNREKWSDREVSFQKTILNTYFRSLRKKCFFCDKNYITSEELEVEQLKALFNIRYISAGRPLDDVSNDKYFTLSKEMVDLLEKSVHWGEIMDELPDKVLVAVEETDAKKTIHQESLEVLQETTAELVSTNGGHTGRPELQLDIEEKNIKTLLSGVIAAKYEVENYHMNEASQGLGLSNMIYIHLQLQKFFKEYDPQKVNLVLLEEPEAHMHPQMQQVFIKYLMEFDKENASEMQGVLTTHSPEMVSIVGVSSLRVVRPKEPFVNRIVDLSMLAKEKVYDLFFEIGYSNIVFADKVILYEGDTERLYLKKLMQLEENQKLKQQYIAYVQVGGAYACNYLKLLRMLQIKTLIITDIDYAKNAVSQTAIKKSKTTNATLKQFYERVEKKRDITVQELYDWKTVGKNIWDNFYLAYQVEEDGRARTLEEAMICKLCAITVDQAKEKSVWRELKKEKKLRFSLPQKKMKNTQNKKGDIKSTCEKTAPQTMITVRDILEATSGGKTDFMYSVLSNNYVREMQPEYIRKGLEWLRED